MNTIRKYWLRIALGGLALLLAAVIAAPYIRVDQYAGEIRSAIERALQRKVDIGKVRLDLLTGPGFSVEDVTIYDVPEAGLEPFAHMAAMNVTVSLRSLWTQRLEIAAIELEEPSVNVVKMEGGASWNVQQLLRRSASAPAPAYFPVIHIDGGRINFKFGDTKSSFYLSDASVSVRPRRSEPGAVLVEFEAAPARTDRAGQGFGRFSGKGRWITSPQGTRLELDAELEETSVDELAVLFQGRSLGLHGLASGSTKIFGPLASPKLLGTITLQDLHRWDMIQAHSGSAWTAKFDGALDLLSGTLELAAGQQRNPGLPVSLRLYAKDLLNQPQWVAEAAIEGLPAPALIHFVRNMGAPLPPGLTVQGTVNGMVGYGSVPGLQGQLRIESAQIALERGPRFDVPNAEVAVFGDELHLLPATVAANNGNAQLEVSYAPLRQQLDARITGKKLRINLLQGGGSGLLAGSSIPVIERLHGGTWTGQVRYTSSGEADPVWRAELEIQDSAIRIPGLANPVQLNSAELVVSDGGTNFRNVRGSAGAIDFTANYRVREGKSSDELELRFKELDLADLEAALLPTLNRDAGFLARTLSFRRAARAPQWLRARRIEGTLHAARFIVGDVSLRNVTGNLTWDGLQVELKSVQAKSGPATLNGTLTADLSGASPRYTLGAHILDLPWRNGLVDVQASAGTAGTGLELMLNLKSEGSFEMRSCALSPEHSLRNASGTFGLAWTRTGPKLRLTGVNASIDGERFSGEGSTRAGGHLQMELASAQRVMRLAGSLAPLKLEITADPMAAR